MELVKYPLGQRTSQKLISSAAEALELRDHLRVLRRARECKSYVAAGEVIADLERVNAYPEKIWLELEHEKTALFLELGDWWRATLSLTHILLHPESAPAELERARTLRAQTAFESGDFDLAERDYALSRHRPSFSLILIGARLRARAGELIDAAADLEQADPNTDLDLISLLRAQLDLKRLSGAPTAALAADLIVLGDAVESPTLQALARLEGLSALGWEPLRVRNDERLAELLPTAPIAQRLLDQLTMTGVERIRSTTATSILRSFRFS